MSQLILPISNIYVVECWDKFGNLRWRDIVKNLIPTEGANDLLDKYLAGNTYTAAWYMGLVDAANFGNGTGGAGFDNSDTAAKITTGAPNYPTTNDWAEWTSYSEATRPSITWDAASNRAKSNNTTPASFSITANGTIKGLFIISDSTKGGTTGILFGEGTLTGGDRQVQNGDTVNAKVTCQVN